MSNSRWYAFKMWLVHFVEGLLPESVRRSVLYTLHDRAYTRLLKKHGEERDPWTIDYEDLYNELRD